ncbi:MAG: hypothetical protein EXR69_06855 [Myxococcales bacterium]|nr:hypothetical protein [Myxococcales bacterium]
MRVIGLLFASLALSAPALSAPALAETGGEPCTATTVADLKDPLLDGEEGVIQLEEDAIRAAATVVDARVRCLGQVLAPVDIAAVHRLHAYAAFVVGDASNARRAFGAARAADPAWGITDRLAPPGTPLRDLFSIASLDVTTETVKVPTGTVLYIDGVRTADRPLDRPAVLQLAAATASGQAGAPRAVLDSFWATADQPLPDWSRFASEAVSSGAGASKAARARSPAEGRSPLPWWVGAGAAVVAGASVYGWAVADHSRYVDTGTALDEAALDALQRTANTKVMVSGGLGAVGIGLAVVAFRW